MKKKSKSSVNSKDLKKKAIKKSPQKSSLKKGKNSDFKVRRLDKKETRKKLKVSKSLSKSKLKKPSSKKKLIKKSKHFTTKTKFPLINLIRDNIKEVSSDLDGKYIVSQKKDYIEARITFDGDPVKMGNIVREIQTNPKFRKKGFRTRYQISFIPDDDLKELKYFKKNRMSTGLGTNFELMSRYRKMIETTKEREWDFKQMFVGIVIDKEGDD